MLWSLSKDCHLNASVKWCWNDAPVGVFMSPTPDQYFLLGPSVILFWHSTTDLVWDRFPLQCALESWNCWCVPSWEEVCSQLKLSQSVLDPYNRNALLEPYRYCLCYMHADVSWEVCVYLIKFRSLWPWPFPLPHNRNKYWIGILINTLPRSEQLTLHCL